jgi:hypothetical protein
VNVNKTLSILGAQTGIDARALVGAETILSNTQAILVPANKVIFDEPYFPSIHIKAIKLHNAWIHIVYTDAQTQKLRTFIDAANIDSSSSTYPFYTYEQDFYDAPLWTYSFFNKPLRFWKGHVFAVKVDHQKKSIHCMGGIAWGFELSYFRLYPKAILPQLLNKDDWDKAWQILEEKLPGYSQTYVVEL